MEGVYLGGYPWKKSGILTAADLNAAVALALSPVRVIPPGSIGNSLLATPWVQIGTTQIQLGATVTTLSGILDPVNPLDVANKHYVDQHVGGDPGSGIPDAPADGTLYGRLNAEWVHAAAPADISNAIAVAVVPASQSVAGIAELATTTEVTAGTDNTTIVTPLTLAQRLATLQAAYVPVLGNTIVNGNLTFAPPGAGASAALILNKPDGNGVDVISGQLNGTENWRIILTDTLANGSNFAIRRSAPTGLTVLTLEAAAGFAQLGPGPVHFGFLTAAGHTPVIAGPVTAVAPADDVLIIAQRRLAAADSTNALFGGPRLTLRGPTSPSNPGGIELMVGTNTAPQSVLINSTGTMTLPASLIVTNAGNIEGGLTVGANLSVGGSTSTGSLGCGSATFTGGVQCTAGLTVSQSGTALQVNGNMGLTGSLSINGSIQGGYNSTWSGTVTASGIAATGSADISGSGGLTVSYSANIGQALAVGSSITCSTLSASSYVNAPSLQGGPTGAGCLATYGGSAHVTFNWAPSGLNCMSFRVNESNDWGIATQNYAAGGAHMLYYWPAGDGPTGWRLDGQSVGGTPCTIYVAGVSDARIKENIRDSEVDALAAILSVPVRAFTYKPGVIGDEAQDRDIGLVTQEVEPHIPSAVGRTHLTDESLPLPDSYLEDMQHLIDQAFTPYFVKAIQQLTERVARLEGGG